MDQIINTILRASGASQFSSQMAQITSSASVAQRAVMGAQNVISGIKVAVAGAIGGFTIGSVLQLGSSFENTQNKMAGFLNALGQAPNFTSALQMSAGVMKKIELTSAALPGEAEDYVRVFTTSLPNVQKSLGGTMDEMVAFTNRIAAVGATFGIDSMQVANDLNRMVQVGRGGAGLDVRTFTSMLPFLQRVEGAANLTAESFNKMNATARAKLLQKGMASLGPMIDHAASSFDAIKGTSQSILKTMFRMGTAGLFDKLKNALSRINALLMDQNGNLTPLAKQIVSYAERGGNAIARFVETSVSWLEKLFSQADKIPGMFEKAEAAIMKAAKAYLFFSAAQTGGGVITGLAGAKRAQGEGAPSGAASVGATILGWLGLRGAPSNALAPVVEMLAPRGALLVGLGALAGAAAIAGSAAYVLATQWDDFAPRIAEVTEQFRTQVLPAIEKAGKEIWRAIEPLVNDAGKAAVNLLIDSFEVLGFVVTQLADAIRWVVNSLPTRGNNQLLEISKQMAAKRHGPRYDMRAHPQLGFQMQEGDFATPKPPKLSPPSARGGTKITQDFRNSRFTIDQKFEEGFDPDRIAFAFANDLRKVGEFKLQSGLEPLFGLGG